MSWFTSSETKPIEIEVTITKDKYEVTKASGRLGDVAWLYHHLKNVSFDDFLMHFDKEDDYAPGKYKGEIVVSGGPVGNPLDGQDYDELTYLPKWERVQEPSEPKEKK